MAFVDPGINRGADFFELAGEEVVGAFDDDEALGLGERREKFSDVYARAELIVATLNYEFWFRATTQVRQVRVIHRKSETD